MRDVSRFPSVTMKEAGSIFGWSKEKFRSVWNEGLQREIRYVEKINGRWLLAEDVFKAAYPTASKHTHITLLDVL